MSSSRALVLPPQLQRKGERPSHTRVSVADLIAAAPKGVTIEPRKLKALLRDEVSARKEFEEREKIARNDVEFLISVARSKFRCMTDVERKRVEKEHPEQRLDIILFGASSPSRSVPEPVRPKPPNTPRVIPTHERAVFDEETELRNWICKLELKMREPLASEEAASRSFLLRFSRCEDEEGSARTQLSNEYKKSHRQLIREEFMERPFGKYSAPREKTFEEVEEEVRDSLQQIEQGERKEAHDWLVMRYGVQLYSVARIEDMYRMEIHAEFEESLVRLLRNFFHFRYRAPLVAMCAFHGRAVLPTEPDLSGQVALLTAANGYWRTK